MKLLGLGLQLLKRRQSTSCPSAPGCPTPGCPTPGCPTPGCPTPGCPTPTSAPGCPPPFEALPPCPRKPTWNFRRALLFSTLTFGAGVYTGIYVSQNYEVPRVDDPKKLVERANEKVRELVEGKKKTPVEQFVDDIKKEAKKIIDD